MTRLLWSGRASIAEAWEPRQPERIESASADVSPGWSWRMIPGSSRTEEVYAPMNTSPPGPRGYPILGMLPYLRKDPLRVYLDAADRYGDFVHMKVGAYHGYLACRPDDIKHVLQDNNRNYHKSPYASA